MSGNKVNNQKLPTDPQAKLETMLGDIAIDADLTEDQREKAQTDMRFIYVSGGMWEGFQEEVFEDRVKLELDIISNHLNRFVGQWNQNRVGVDYKPYDSKASDEDGELLNGIYRADYQDGSGKMAVDNMVDEVGIAGYGCYKIATRYEDEGDPENNHQRIEFRPIHNAFNSVIWDSAAKRIDKRDARRCVHLTQYTKHSFESNWPDKDPVSAFVPETGGEFDSCRASESEIIYVATRYEIVKKKATVYTYSNMVTDDVEVYSEEDHALIEQELKDDEHRKLIRKRKIVTQICEKTVFSGADILEKTTRIHGKYIPIIASYGYRAFIDGVEWYYGLVRKLIDAQRLWNMQISQIAEDSASSGQEVPIFDPDQMPKPIAETWADKNNNPYQLAKVLRDSDGNIVHMGPLGYSKPATLDQATDKLMAIIPAYIQDHTGSAPQDILDPKASGKAIRALQKREDLNTQVLNDNIANSITWGGEVYASMASEVYNQERMIRTVGADGVEGHKALLKMVFDEKTLKFVRSNDLRGKKFKVYSDIGPQYQTLKEESVEDLKGMMDLLINVPGGQDMIQPMLAIMIENMSGAGMAPLKKLNRQNMLAQGLVEPETDEEKAFVAKLQEPQDDAQGELAQSLAMQAKAEAKKFVSEARNLDAKSMDNVASAEKKVAETKQIISETENAKARTIIEIRDGIKEEVESLPLG